ncbi:hypothetical protein KEM52_006427 [Ascosphaera acerosa]|nr:hypothetical protein KEM52_006427 [Ascosphaera acerosa]
MDCFKPRSTLPVPDQDICSWLFDRVTYNPDKPVYIDVDDPSIYGSWSQARELVRQLIAGLRAAGFSEGDCLNLHSFNHVFYPIIVLATIGAGGVVSCSNPAGTEQELEHHLKTARCSWLVAQAEALDNAVRAATTVGIAPGRIFVLDSVVTTSTQHTGLKSWRDLLACGEAEWVRFNDRQRAASTTAARLFTSGTTGLPKAISLSHRNFLAQHVCAMDEFHPDYIRRILIALPSFPAGIFTATNISALKTGEATFLMPCFDLLKFVQAHAKHRITELVTSPPMVNAILNSPLSQTDCFRTIRRGFCGAAPLDKDTQQRFRDLLAPGATYTQVWGMTEATTLITGWAPWEDDSTGSVGRQLSGIEIKLVDEAGRNVTAYNTCAEILVRGPTVAQGYYGNAEATRTAFDEDGWFHTGDIGYCDEATQKWYIIDRKKELITTRRTSIAPIEIEAALLAHAEIADCAVIGAQCTSLVAPTASDTATATATAHAEDSAASAGAKASAGEGHGSNKADAQHPRAYVVRKPGSKLTKLDVWRLVAAKLGPSRQLTGGVKFVKGIPKTATGKIRKRTLREQAAMELAEEAIEQAAQPARL